MKRARVAHWVAWTAFAFTAVRVATGYACASCGCGDPTLTAMGTEKPFRNRLRASIDVRYRTDEVGEPGVDRIQLRETRFDGQVAWAPHERLFLLGTVPLLQRSAAYVNGGENSIVAIGDIEMRAKVFVFADRPAFAHHLFAVTVGIKMPTAPRQRDAVTGHELPIEAQAGTGSWDPLLGMSYAHYAKNMSFYASVQGTTPIRGTSDFRASSSLRTTTAMQAQAASRIALRIGIDTRLDGKSFEDGRPERDSSGLIGFVSPELLFTPVTDLLVVISFRIPVVQALAGYHHEGSVGGVAIAYDF